MESIWSKTVNIKPRKTVTQDMNTKVIIIGAGMAGVLTGVLLKKQGVECIILEADEVGSGQTANTTAKITSQHGLFYTNLAEKFGEQKAKEYAEANQNAINQYKEIIKEMKIECDFEDRKSYVYDIGTDDKLRKETNIAKKLGLPASFVKQLDLPFDTAGAVCFDNQAQFHPLKFLQKASENLEIYTKSKVTSIVDNKVFVNGRIINAEHIVFACHTPFINTPGYYFARMHQSRAYTVAIENAKKIDGMYVGVKDDSISLRSYGDLLIVCGMDHRTGENKSGGRYDKLTKMTKEWYPKSRVVEQWSAQDGMSADAVPYIGTFAKSKPNWYVATGFGKWGMSTSMVSAQIITGIITGEKEDNENSIFSPQRFNRETATEIITGSKYAVKGLVMQRLTLKKKTLDELPKSHGGIVEVNGVKVGVYKTESGETFVLDTKCPHMGCQLEWNPDEISWDCPCHGSRFDYTGKLLDGPAQEGLK